MPTLPPARSLLTTTSSWESYIQNDEARSWVTVTPSAGEEAGEHTVQILLDENTTGNPRTVRIDLNCQSQTETITINQEAVRQDGSFPESYERIPSNLGGAHYHHRNHRRSRKPE